MSVQLVAVIFFEGVICMFCSVCLTVREVHVDSVLSFISVNICCCPVDFTTVDIFSYETH